MTGKRPDGRADAGTDAFHDEVMQAAFGGMPALDYKPDPWLVAEVLALREPQRPLLSSLTQSSGPGGGS